MNLLIRLAMVELYDVSIFELACGACVVRAGDEVAQLYIHQRTGTSARPIRELKGFQRISLKPGEIRNLRFVLKPDDLRYWTAVPGSWVQDESKFDVWVGGSSTADLAASFEVKR